MRFGREKHSNKVFGGFAATGGVIWLKNGSLISVKIRRRGLLI
jgi:hypothetical protein